MYHSFRTQFYTSSIPNTLPDPDSWSSQANFPSSRVRCLPLTWLTLFLRWKQIEVWVKKSKEIQDEIQKLSEDLRWRAPLEDWGSNRFSETFISLSCVPRGHPGRPGLRGNQGWTGIPIPDHSQEYLGLNVSFRSVHFSWTLYLIYPASKNTFFKTQQFDSWNISCFTKKHKCSQFDTNKYNSHPFLG